MKKVLLISFLVTSIVIQGFSQSKIIMPSSQYEILKSKGQLKQGVEYVPISENHPSSVSSKVTKEHLDRMNYKSVNTTSCSCLVPIDGTFSVAEFVGYTPPDYRNDDASTALKALPFTFCMYGSNYNSVYINNNGNITFDVAYSQFSAVGFPSSSYVMVAPFWADVDTRGAGSGLVYYKITPTYMIVQWKNVGYYSSYTNMLNTFQLIITDGTDPILPSGNNIAFCYGDMQWTTGDASGGATTGFGGTAATVGINKGDNISYVQMGRFDQPGLVYDGGYGNNDGVSWLDNQSMYFNVCSGTNIAPIASGLNNCDTIKICGSGDTLYLNGLFLAPEIGQNTTITVNLMGTPNASVISNVSGNSADAVVMIVATTANAGVNTIQFTATDDGIPVGTTVVNVNIYVDTTNLTNFNPIITGNLEFCEGSSSVLTVNPGTYDNYVWNNGTYGTSLTVDTTGTYYCTASLNGCYKSTSVQVVDHLNPVPLITGPTFTCNGNPTIIYLDNSTAYTSYTWSNSTTNDSLGTSGGTYTITVTDTNGCHGTSLPITVTNITPQVTISGYVPFCPGDSAALIANPNPTSGATYSWSTGETAQSIQATAAGTYTVTVTYLGNGCSSDTTIIVTTLDPPAANFSASPGGQSGPLVPISFTDASTVPSGTIATWTWDFGDSTGVTHTYLSPTIPTHSYAVNGMYIVTLKVCGSNGCCSTIEYPYTIVSEIEMPNVITPNNPGANGLNQFLYFKHLEYFPGSKLLVYNRWGNKVFESNDYDNKWNGGKESDGVYYYILSGPLFKEAKYGFFHLLR